MALSTKRQTPFIQHLNLFKTWNLLQFTSGAIDLSFARIESYIMLHKAVGGLYKELCNVRKCAVSKWVLADFSRTKKTKIHTGEIFIS